MKTTVIFLVVYVIDLVRAFNVKHNAKNTFKVNANDISRRKSIEKLLTPIAASTLITIGSPNVVCAKEAATPQTLSNAFNKVKTELTSSSGGISTLSTLIDNQDWENVKEFTKNYDIEFRKEMMGSARKMIPKDNNKQLRSDATQMCNNVTFDLIAVNKASRVGDPNAATKAFGILKNDISEFLELESKVVWE